MSACVPVRRGEIFRTPPPALLNKLGGTAITHVLLLGLALALCLKVYINPYVTLLFLTVCVLRFPLCTLPHGTTPFLPKESPLPLYAIGMDLICGWGL